jgi:hypothetical protein
MLGLRLLRAGDGGKEEVRRLSLAPTLGTSEADSWMQPTLSGEPQQSASNHEIVVVNSMDQ